MAALLLNSCAVQIHDEQWCSPLPQNIGATCDNFLTSHQLVLNELQWIQLQQSWNKSGQAVECTSSGTIGDIKKEIEQLCSVAACDSSTQVTIIRGLEKIRTLGMDRLP